MLSDKTMKCTVWKTLVGACSLFAAVAGFADGLADPLADAVHHFVFDKDINGDGFA